MGTVARTTEVRNGPLRAAVAEIGSVCTISLSGELDHSSVETLKKLLVEFEAGASETIVFDLDGLDFVDSAGIAVLLDAHLRLEGGGVRQMRIVPSSDASVRRIFTITGLDDRLPFVSGGPPA